MTSFEATGATIAGVLALAGVAVTLFSSRIAAVMSARLRAYDREHPESSRGTSRRPVAPAGVVAVGAAWILFGLAMLVVVFVVA